MDLPIIERLKRIDNAITELTASIGATHEEDLFAKDFLAALHTLLAQYQEGMNMNSFIMEALKVCCAIHQADWCGILVADATSGVWAPSAWYSVAKGPMAPTRFDENEYFEDVPQWVEALKNNKPIIVTKVDGTYENRKYHQNGANSIIGVPFTFRPTGFLVVRNPTRYVDRPDFLQLVVFGGRLIYETPVMLMSPQQRTEATNIRLNIFGVPSITILGKTITAKDYNASMSWKLLIYLALSKTPKGANEIAAALWQTEDNTQPQGNNVRATIYRIRERLARQLQQDLIVNQNGYRLNPNLNITTDAQEMERLWSEARRIQIPARRIALLERAFALHTGKVYDAFSHEPWLMSYASYYTALYLKITAMLLEMLYYAGDYESVQKYVFKALPIVHANKDMTYWLILALVKSGNHALAKQKYEDAQDMLTREEYDELTNQLKKEMRK